jgi:ABC-2 type transport system permease protein
LDNGTFFTGGLPGLGYDEDDEVSSPYERKKNGLPEKKDEDLSQDDPVAKKTLRAGKAAGLFQLDITVSAPIDQQAIAPGELIRSWRQNGRNMFHFVLGAPGMYPPFSILCARYEESRDSIMLRHKVYIDVLHDRRHTANTARFINAYKESLKYFSEAYGDYPFNNIRVVETSSFGPRFSSQATLDTYAEYNNWNAHFTDPNQFDFISFNIARATAQQWWRFKVAPNATIGSLVIPEGLSVYSAFVFLEKKYGQENMRRWLLDQLWLYLFIRHRTEEVEHPLITANLRIEWADKAGVALYGLRRLIGEDNMNQALGEFENVYAFKKDGPYAGANDLYFYLKKHTPDSLQYFLDDSWKKVTLYDNRVKSVTINKTPGKEEYNVTVKVSVDKSWLGEKGDVPAKQLDDYIDIGLFGETIKAHDSLAKVNPIYVKRYKLTRGDHTFNITLSRRPVSAGIDPYGFLIDRKPEDNFYLVPEK